MRCGQAMQDRQASKKIIVTGAAGRIGAALVYALAQDGWQVLLHYNQRRQEAEALCRTLAIKAMP